MKHPSGLYSYRYFLHPMCIRNLLKERQFFSNIHVFQNSNNARILVTVSPMQPRAELKEGPSPGNIVLCRRSLILCVAFSSKTSSTDIYLSCLPFSVQFWLPIAIQTIIMPALTMRTTAFSIWMELKVNIFIWGVSYFTHQAFQSKFNQTFVNKNSIISTDFSIFFSIVVSNKNYDSSIRAWLLFRDW